MKGTRIGFAPKLPRTFGRKKLERQLREHTLIKHPESLVQCWLPVTARTFAAAFDIASARLDLLRGIWNHWINRDTALRSSAGMRKPVNSIGPGPVHTLHLAADLSVAERFWYQLPNEQREDLFDFARSAGAWRKTQRYTQQLLAAHPYREDLETLFIRYCRALDGLDFDVAFIRLWGVFEALTGAGADYDAAIRRAMFLSPFAEEKTSCLLLEHLRDVRNGTVHNDRSRFGIEDHLYLLKDHVEALLEFHLAARPRFKSIGAAAEFLDLPRDPECLAYRSALYHRARQFRAKREQMALRREDEASNDL